MKRSEIEKSDKWDLSNFIKDEKGLEEKLEQLDVYFKKLLTYKGHIMQSSESLYNFYQDYIEFSKLEEDVFVYVNLLYDEDRNNNKNHALELKVSKIMEDYSPKLAFIATEMLEADYDNVLQFIDENDKLKPFSFDLEKTFRYKEHILSESEEKVLSLASSALGVGSEAFSALNNADIDLGEIEDENGNIVKLNNSNYTKYIKSNNRDVRHNAFKNMYKFWESHKNTVASTYKGQIKEDFFISKIRVYKSPLQASLFSDNINPNLYKTLINKVSDNVSLLHKYYKLKKKALKLDELHMYDIYTDFIKVNSEDITFEEGKKILFEGLKPLGEKYLNDLNQAFEQRWIDIYPNDGKKSGAYNWGTYNSLPYVLLNYENNRESVETMAHELGHAMHSYYSNKNQNYVNHAYPIFLAEIASTVNEIILNEYLINNAKTKEEKILYINDFLDKLKGTLFRQTQFSEFESIVHEKEEKGIPLTEEELSNTYYELNKKYYGPDVVSDEEIRYEWMRIPHFYTPFYVYKYATGISAACSIAKGILDNEAGALENYLKFLSSGCSDYPLNILKNVGVDMESGEPIQNALNLFEERLEMLNKLLDN